MKDLFNYIKESIMDDDDFDNKDIQLSLDRSFSSIEDMLDFFNIYFKKELTSSAKFEKNPKPMNINPQGFVPRKMDVKQKFTLKFRNNRIHVVVDLHGNILMQLLEKVDSNLYRRHWSTEDHRAYKLGDNFKEWLEGLKKHGRNYNDFINLFNKDK